MQENTWHGGGLSVVRPKVSSILATIVLLLAIGVFHVWLRIEVTQCDYAVSRLEQQVRATEYEHKSLTVSVARLTNPRHIEHIATTRLGLTAPSTEQVIIVR
ncbi:MAG: cell division protein FtsL [Thermodesulfobacteriota bacterium]|nr:cell division protein FtsL [Thermodesulfobacteriota bacterium]